MKHKAITEASLHELVDSFSARVRKDPLIGPLFNEAVDDWPRHLDELQAFWSSAMLGDGYRGRALPADIQYGDRIGLSELARWLALWKEAAEELFDRPVAQALQEKAGTVAESLFRAMQLNRGRKFLFERRSDPHRIGAETGEGRGF